MADTAFSIRDEQAERAVIGAMLCRNEAIGEVARILDAADYAFGPHADMHTAILAVHGTACRPVDHLLLADELRRVGKLEFCGDAQTLRNLAEMAGGGFNAAAHARIVKEKSLLRKIALAADHVAQQAHHPRGPARQVLEEAENAFYVLRPSQQPFALLHVSEVAGQWGDQYDERVIARTEGRSIAVEPCVPGLKSLVPGFFAGELVLIAGRPGSGKTAVALAMVRGAMEEGRAVMFASLEMGSTQLFERMVASQAGVAASRLRTASLSYEDHQAAMRACEALRDLPLWIEDTPSQTVGHIHRQARRLSGSQPLGLVVIDYAGLVAPDDKRAQRNEQVALVSRSCKLMAKSLNLPVMLLAQLNRESEHRAGGKPKLSDLRESGGLEQDADTAILLHCPNPDGDELDLIVAKQRSGPLGEVGVLFRRHLMRFDDLPGGAAGYNPFN